MNSCPIIRLQNVWKSFGQQAVLQGVNLELSRNKVNVIIGGSGGGKSVLLKHIIGLMKPDKGRIFIDGQETTYLNEREMYPIRRKFGMLFQEGALFDSMNVTDNVAFPLREHSGKTEAEILDIVEEKLMAVGLKNMGGKMPSELSGGMRKRVGLARALALNPQIVMFDEPTSGLDPVMSSAISELISTIQQDTEATCVVISHDIGAAMSIAHSMSMLYQGKIIAQGTPLEMRDMDNPIVQQFIHGRIEGPIQVV